MLIWPIDCRGFQRTRVCLVWVACAEVMKIRRFMGRRALPTFTYTTLEFHSLFLCLYVSYSHKTWEKSWVMSRTDVEWIISQIIEYVPENLYNHEEYVPLYMGPINVCWLNISKCRSLAFWDEQCCSNVVGWAHHSNGSWTCINVDPTLSRVSN